METNEIMVNEDVIETTEEIVKASFDNGFKMAAGIGLAVVVGIVAYRYIAKPIYAKIKAKKERQATDSEIDGVWRDPDIVIDEGESEETE
ncbi:hypothetical protein FACS189499_04840 [Clostridia bacterium]|nr:hypothetical protein FACS189499_04840 [Clostridia bacterium]